MAVMRGAKLVGAVHDGRTARRTTTRKAIITAATTLFAGKGVTSTSIDEIAEKAGTAKGSVFYNFGSKAGLVGELFENYAEILDESIQAETVGKQGEALRAGVVRGLLTQLHENTAAARVIIAESFRTDRDWAEAVRRWREVATAPIVEDYVAEHGEQEREYAHIVAASLIGATLTAGLEWLAFHPEAPQSDVERALLQVLRLKG